MNIFLTLSINLNGDLLQESRHFIWEPPHLHMLYSVDKMETMNVAKQDSPLWWSPSSHSGWSCVCLDLERFSPEDARGFSLACICGGAGMRWEVSTLSLAALAVLFPGELSVKNRGTDGMKGERALQLAVKLALFWLVVFMAVQGAFCHAGSREPACLGHSNILKNHSVKWPLV